MSETNVIKAKFRESPINQMMDEIRQVIRDEKYNECTVSECVGVLEMLKIELIQVNR